MNDVLGRAIFDYHQNQVAGKLWINNKYGPREEMPIETYFRGEEDMPDIEWMALEQCRGAVLDIGAGAGSHALVLQEWKVDVTAMDISPLCVKVMQERGVKNVFGGDIFKLDGPRFDTLLMLMNGMGLAGTLDGLRTFLQHCKNLLKPDGQLLFDSSDVAYLYDGTLPAQRYYGEIEYQYSYKNQKTEWFSWLYVDELTLHKIAAEMGYQMEVLIDDEFGQYLTRLTLA